MGTVDFWKSQVSQRQNISGLWEEQGFILVQLPHFLSTDDGAGGLRMMYMQASSKHPAAMQLGMFPTLWCGNSWHAHTLSGCQNSALLLSKPVHNISLSRGAYDASGNRSDVMLVLILLSCFATMETGNDRNKGNW